MTGNVERGGLLNLRQRTLFLLLTGFLVASGPAAYADIINTPVGATWDGQPVDASAQFTTGAGFVDITLTNLEADPISVSQLISGLDFVLSDGATSGTLGSSSGQQITVASNGSFTLGSTGSTGWGLNNNVGGGLQLDALGFIGPQGLIIGAPGTGGIYDAANNSITGNKAHNPFLNQTATFHVLVDGVTANTTVTSATILFGTTPSGPSVPEPGSLLSLAALFGGVALVLKKRGSRLLSR